MKLACNFIKKRLKHRYFLVNIAKYLRTAFLWNISGDCYYVKSLKELQSVTKIMGKTAIWTVLCFSPLPPLNNVNEQ